jgi:hypothetical protein
MGFLFGEANKYNYCRDVKEHVEPNRLMVRDTAVFLWEQGDD